MGDITVHDRRYQASKTQAVVRWQDVDSELNRPPNPGAHLSADSAIRNKRQSLWSLFNSFPLFLSIESLPTRNGRSLSYPSEVGLRQWVCRSSSQGYSVPDGHGGIRACLGSEFAISTACPKVANGDRPLSTGPLTVPVRS